MKRWGFLIATLTACGGGGGGNHNNFFPTTGDLAVETTDDAQMNGAGDMAGPASRDLSFQPPVSDFAMQQTPPDLSQVAKAAVGATCASALGCSGPNAQCYNTLPGTVVKTPGGYCSNKPCANDNDCGNLGVCIDLLGNGASFCLGACAAKGDCAAVNPANRCFYATNTDTACLPASISACDPTSANSCTRGECNREGIDDVGACFTLCNFGGACAADSQGRARQCYYMNMRVNSQGKATGDYWSGLVCLLTGNNLGPNVACTYVDDCQNGYECNFFQINGTPKVCKKQCRNGTPADCNGTGGTCQDAFRTGLNNGWVNGQIGLCL